MSVSEVQDGVVVSLEYTLRLADGAVLDTSVGEPPVQFLQGRGNIIPGLERALYGMKVGETKEVVLSPEEGYGERDPNAYQLVPRSSFPDDLELEVGMGFRMRTPLGGSIDAYIEEIRPDGVLLDLNHPLAGQTLYFTVKVVDLRPATAEELEHGHVHGAE